MSVSTPFAVLIAAEQALGDPAVAQNTISFRRSMQLDEAEAFPESMVSALHAQRLHHHYVPTELGGAFESCETIVALARVLSRRDLTLAVTYGTLLWTMLVWIGGDDTFKRRIATLVLETGVFPCLAYSEAAHGADLVANEAVAHRDGDGYRVNGEKWPINRATRSDLVVLLARTGGHNARGLSLFMIDKRELAPFSYRHLPRVKTLGLRGCDISGIGFTDSLVAQSARVGREGAGLELALKGFQVTRTLCAGLSLGAGDTALRSVASFVLRRRLYGAAAATLPYVRDVLANAYLNLLMAECMTLVSARGMHLHPGEFSLWSAVVKIQTPAFVDQANAELSSVLGARFYMREEHEEGIFQKMVRDSQIVSVFDGSTAVCLASIAAQLRAAVLARRRAAPLDDEALRALYEIEAPLPGFSPERFEVFGRGCDVVLRNLPRLAELLEAHGSNVQSAPDSASGTYGSLLTLSRGLLERLAALDADVIAAHESGVPIDDARLFSLAQRYCGLHAAATCLGVWLFNRERFGPFCASGTWIAAALQRAGEPSFRAGELAVSLRESLMERVIAQYESHHLFSLFDVPLAPHGSLEARTTHLTEEQGYGT